MNPGNYTTVALVWLGIGIGCDNDFRSKLLMGGALIFIVFALALRAAARRI